MWPRLGQKEETDGGFCVNLMPRGACERLCALFRWSDSCSSVSSGCEWPLSTSTNAAHGHLSSLTSTCLTLVEDGAHPSLRRN